MASIDFQQFAIARIAPASMTVPRWTIGLLVTDAKTGAVLRDFTGANALTFPNVLGQLTNAEQDELVERIVQFLVLKRAGLG